MKLKCKVNEVKLNMHEMCFVTWSGLYVCVPQLTKATQAVSFALCIIIYRLTLVQKYVKIKTNPDVQALSCEERNPV